MNWDHFSNLSFSQPKVAPYEIWAKLAQRRSFEILNIFPIQMHKEAKIQPLGILGSGEEDF